LSASVGVNDLSSEAMTSRFRRARRDPSQAVLEGFHPLKHAVRFGAELIEVVTEDEARLARHARALAPDVADALAAAATLVSREVFRRLAPVPPPTGVIAIARRPAVRLAGMLDAPGPEPVVVLEQPARLGNLGAAVRAAAAAGAAGVIAIGSHDPWQPEALRGGAGLQYALPVTRADVLPASDRPQVAVDPGGEPLRSGSVPPPSLLAFGSERMGLSPSLMSRADHCVGIPMRAGVSSLNLATAVAVVLYAWRAAAPEDRTRRGSMQIGVGRRVD
jgi:TrmH family RNA methyltransferase